MRSPFDFDHRSGPVVMTAIHAGHDLRPAIAALTALDDATRLREEDPFTDRLIPDGCGSVVVRRSRFEVDLNRVPETAVYRQPEDAWGLELWSTDLDDAEVAESMGIYDDFYARLGEHLDVMAAQGPFVVLDLHSYNHRRLGASAAAAPEIENPEINVGTGSLDRGRWGELVDGLMEDLRLRTAGGHHLDVRENVKFRGRKLSQWVNERYADRGCAISLEFKKVFMDEWTGRLDRSHLAELADAVAAAVPGLTTRLGAGR
jgi:N-formylglutamate deformylase